LLWKSETWLLPSLWFIAKVISTNSSKHKKWSEFLPTTPGSNAGPFLMDKEINL
jgi:hypothetical protein